MAFINFTTEDNGILFDLSDMPDAGTKTDKFVFRPSVFHTITRVSVRDNRMSYTTVENTDFNFSFDGVEFTKLQINGMDATDNYDLFTKFIALL